VHRLLAFVPTLAIAFTLFASLVSALRVFTFAVFVFLVSTVLLPEFARDVQEMLGLFLVPDLAQRVDARFEAIHDLRMVMIAPVVTVLVVAAVLLVATVLLVCALCLVLVPFVLGVLELVRERVCLLAELVGPVVLTAGMESLGVGMQLVDSGARHVHFILMTVNAGR
jgi:hypothetical protein